jgi:hypothetical protein
MHVAAEPWMTATLFQGRLLVPPVLEQLWHLLRLLLGL